MFALRRMIVPACCFSPKRRVELKLRQLASGAIACLLPPCTSPFFGGQLCRNFWSKLPTPQREQRDLRRQVDQRAALQCKRWQRVWEGGARRSSSRSVRTAASSFFGCTRT